MVRKEHDDFLRYVSFLRRRQKGRLDNDVEDIRER